jgi:hypothetical protein
MTLTKQENKEIEKQVDQLKGKFFDSVFELVDSMYYESDLTKQEIRKILIRDLRMGITVSFEEFKNDTN